MTSRDSESVINLSVVNDSKDRYLSSPESESWKNETSLVRVNRRYVRLRTNVLSNGDNVLNLVLKSLKKYHFRYLKGVITTVYVFTAFQRFLCLM